MVVNELCERQAQPAEEARLAKPLDHDHHARDEEDGDQLMPAVPPHRLRTRSPP